LRQQRNRNDGAASRDATSGKCGVKFKELDNTFSPFAVCRKIKGHDLTATPLTQVAVKLLEAGGPIDRACSIERQAQAGYTQKTNRLSSVPRDKQLRFR
jgi:hypothetical protein